MDVSDPEGWERVSISEAARPDSPVGYGIVQPGPHDPSGVPVLAIRDLARPSMWTAHRSSTRIEAGYRRSRVTSSDLLVSVKGTISRDVARVRLCSHHVPEYWLQLLRSDAAQRAVRDASVGTTRMELSIATLKLLTFRVPAVAEQRRIAETLSQGDALVAALERLIAKKEAMKQGLMQELLSGRTRLPGFEGEWKERELGSLADIVSGGTPSSSIPAYWAGGIPWCTPTDITSQIGRHLHQTERTITKEGLDACSARLLPSGSVLPVAPAISVPSAIHW